MMAKDNFDFDTEGKGKFNLDFGFLKNLTPKQKEMILMITIGVIALIVIVVVGVILMTANGGNGGGNAGGVTGDNGETDTGGNNGEESDGVPDVITNFYISAVPTKSIYYVGDTADYSGLIVYVKSSDGVSMYISYNENPTEFTITGFDSSTVVEQQVITVECKGFTDTFTIEVKEIEKAEPKLISIHLSTYPKQVFSVDDKFSFGGAVLTCTYDDGNTVDIPLKLQYMYGVNDIFDESGAHNLLPGEHTIQIEYGENGVFVQTEYTITVN